MNKTEIWVVCKYCHTKHRVSPGETAPYYICEESKPIALQEGDIIEIGGMSELEWQLDMAIDARHAEIEKRFSHEVVEELMNAFHYIKPRVFAKLLRFKWMEYVEMN